MGGEKFFLRICESPRRRLRTRARQPMVRECSVARPCACYKQLTLNTHINPSMTELRVLVVDASVNTRKRVGDAIKATAALSLCGVASNGSIAIQKVGQERPDLLVLDTDLEGLDCVDFIKESMDRLPDLKVVLFGRSARRGSELVMDSIASGASGYVTKPEVDSIKDAGWNCIEKELVPMLEREGARQASIERRLPTLDNNTMTNDDRSAVELEVATRRVGDHIRNQVKVIEGKKSKFLGPVSLVCIGSSTGGPNALAELFSTFPKHFPVPIVITQHMPPMFTKMLAQRLNGLDTLKFHEAEEGMELKASHGYIAPGGKHMTVHRSAQGGFHVRLNEEPPENSCRPAVDVMLRSVADCVQGGTLITILTGMGKDGYLGCRQLSDLGATVFAQDEESSVVWGMPGFVASAGLADKVLPLDSMAQAILEHVGVNQTLLRR